MMARAAAAAALVLGACGFPHPAGDAGAGTDARGDASADGPPADAADPGTCPLPSLALHVATLAGCGPAGTTDGPRGTARFDNPVNVVLAPSGLAYVADFDSSLLRKIDTTGSVTTLVAQPTFQRPFGLALAANGFLYVETDDDDQGQHSLTTGTLWKVNPATGAASVIARDLGRPRGLAVLPDGRIAAADHQHHVVELLDPATGAVTPLAGMYDVPGHVDATGSAARFAEPYDVVVLGGALIVSDFDNHVLRRVTLTGEVSDFAGSGEVGHADGPAASATFSQPKGLAIDGRGAIYVTDPGNHDVRRIAAGAVSTVAGSLVAGWRDDDDPLAAQFYGIEGLDVSADGSRLVVADGTGGDGSPYNHVRVITR